MKAVNFLVFSLLTGTAFAQSPAAQTRTYSSDLAFSYTLPAEWSVVQTQAPPAKADVKGLECVKMELTARHGSPASVIVEAALPYDCYGQQMTEQDLPGFAATASEGLRQNFDIAEPTTATYRLGTHSVWVERVKGSPKAAPSAQYIIEIACTPLKKAGVCWIAMAADDTALRTFESGRVTLDGEASDALVPASAFSKSQ